jgi:hypothetical protein
LQNRISVWIFNKNKKFWLRNVNNRLIIEFRKDYKIFNPNYHKKLLNN